MKIAWLFAALLWTVHTTAEAASPAVRAVQLDADGNAVEMGGGPAETPLDDLSEAERASIQQAIEENRERLIAEGRLSRVHAKTLTNFTWPLRQAAGRTDFNYHGISNYVDENPLYPNYVLDYYCGNRTYDLASGYNHQGTDIFIWPWAWKKMDDEDVVIVAGAPGTIIYKSDGNFDRSCAMGSGTWNAVYVQHADGSVAWYGHMKNGSLTVKGVGETVAVGEYLGSVGSSGSSTGPHLHVELYDASNNLVDPWLGACNSKSKQVTWAQQRAYRDTSINALTVGTAAPLFPACPNDETTYAVDYVAPGATVYFAAYLRDQVPGSPVSIRIKRPDGSVYFSATGGDATYDGSYWYWYFTTFPSTTGTWTFEANIVGQSTTFARTFQVGGSAPYGTPAAIATVGGSGQVTPPGAPFAAPLKVKVTDALARAVKGARVSFTVPASGPTAVLESRSAITDASGIASVSAIANAQAGIYSVTASVSGAAPANVSLQNGSIPNPPRLYGISTRLNVQTGDNVMIGGFILGGATPKTVVIRARGPSLGVAGALADPVLTLVPASGGQVLSNDDWQADVNAVGLLATGFAPGHPKESAILATLAPGAYTAIVTGAGNTTGVAIVEVYELDRPEIPTIGISTRGLVQTADNVMIGGFIIQGTGPQTVVVRARGPSLGVAGALADPVLTVVPAAGGPTLTNDDWQTDVNAAALLASGFAPGDAKEAALLLTLNPGAYTAIVSGAAGSTGVAIVEVYIQ